MAPERPWKPRRRHRTNAAHEADSLYLAFVLCLLRGPQGYFYLSHTRQKMSDKPLEYRHFLIFVSYSKSSLYTARYESQDGKTVRRTTYHTDPGAALRAAEARVDTYWKEHPGR